MDFWTRPGNDCVCASTAKKQYNFRDADLQQIVCEVARNPHYSSRCMYLYEIGRLREYVLHVLGKSEWEQRQLGKRKRAEVKTKYDQFITAHLRDLDVEACKSPPPNTPWVNLAKKLRSFRRTLKEELGAEIMEELKSIQAWMQERQVGTEHLTIPSSSRWRYLYGFRSLESIVEEHQMEQRRADLIAALAAKNLQLRSDSVMCREYIEHGERSLEEVVDIMHEMQFFFSQTSYREELTAVFRAHRGKPLDDPQSIAKERALAKWCAKHPMPDLATLPVNIRNRVYAYGGY